MSLPCAFLYAKCNHNIPNDFLKVIKSHFQCNDDLLVDHCSYGSSLRTTCQGGRDTVSVDFSPRYLFPQSELKEIRVRGKCLFFAPFTVFHVGQITDVMNALPPMHNKEAHPYTHKNSRLAISLTIIS